MKAGGSLAAKLGAFVFIYTGSALAAKHARGAVETSEVDVPSSVVGGAVAGLTFGAPAGVHSASMGLLRGGALGFAFGAFQYGANLVIAGLEGEADPTCPPGGSSEVVSSGAPVAAQDSESPTGGPRDLAVHLDKLAKRMDEVSRESKPLQK